MDNTVFYIVSFSLVVILVLSSHAFYLLGKNVSNFEGKRDAYDKGRKAGYREGFRDAKVELTCEVPIVTKDSEEELEDDEHEKGDC